MEDLTSKYSRNRSYYYVLLFSWSAFKQYFLLTFSVIKLIILLTKIFFSKEMWCYCLKHGRCNFIVSATGILTEKKSEFSQ